MTRNEIRRANNLPAIPGGDELVVPLNLSEGPQESTEETSTEAATDPDVTDEIEPPEAVKAVLTRHSARARRVIASKGSSPALTSRLTRELGTDLADFPEWQSRAKELHEKWVNHGD